MKKNRRANQRGLFGDTAGKGSMPAASSLKLVITAPYPPNHRADSGSNMDGRAILNISAR